MSDPDFPRWGYVSSSATVSGSGAANASAIEAAGGVGPLVLSFHTSESDSSGVGGVAGRQLASQSSPSSSGSSSRSVRTVVQQLINVTDSRSSSTVGTSQHQEEQAVTADGCHGDCRLQQLPTNASSADDSTIAFRQPVADQRFADCCSTTLTTTSDEQSATLAVGAAVGADSSADDAEPPEQTKRAAATASSAAAEAAAVTRSPARAARGGCGALAEFHKYWSSPDDSSRSSQPRSLQGGQSVRFAPPIANAANASRSTGRRPRGNSRGRGGGGGGGGGGGAVDLRRLVAAAAAARFPAWRESAGTNFANASNPAPSAPRQRPSATGAAASAAPAGGASTAAKKADKNDADRSQSPSCLSECSVLRCLGLIAYYLTLWAAGAGFTWLILELSLSLTSRGAFPYYMAPHSFCLTSPAIGFPGGDPEPGKVTAFASLASLNDTLIDKLTGQFLRTGAAEVRQCDLPGNETTDSAVLMRPCNLTGFASAAIAQLRDLLKDRPAVVVQIKRHLGYLPATGSHVTISCKASVSGADLALRYHNWNLTKLTESDKSGSVPTVYFPMLSRWHSAPAVLVSLAKADSSLWTGKELKIRCQADDGGPTKPPEREIILKIG